MTGNRSRMSTNEPDQDRFEERAAIMEHDGGLSRKDAEQAAADEQGLPLERFALVNIDRTAQAEDIPL